MKRGCPRHPKVAHLRELLKISLPTAIGILELLFHFVAEFCPQGDVGRYSDARIEAALAWTGQRGKLVQCLTDAGWLDRHSEWRLVLHDWHEHADSAVKKRLERSHLEFLSDTAKLTGQRQPSADDGGLARALSNPSPDPSPEPVPDPTAIDTQRFAQNPREDAGRPEVASPNPAEPKPKPAPNELRETLALWKRIHWTESAVARVRAQLGDVPEKVFAAHLDQMPGRFQPGGAEEAHEVGFFVSTARNFTRAYSVGAGSGLAPEKFDEMTAVLDA